MSRAPAASAAASDWGHGVGTTEFCKLYFIAGYKNPNVIRCSHSNMTDSGTTLEVALSLQAKNQGFPQLLIIFTPIFNQTSRPTDSCLLPAL